MMQTEKKRWEDRDQEGMRWCLRKALQFCSRRPARFLMDSKYEREEEMQPEFVLQKGIQRKYKQIVGWFFFFFGIFFFYVFVTGPSFVRRGNAVFRESSPVHISTNSSGAVTEDQGAAWRADIQFMTNSAANLILYIFQQKHDNDNDNDKWRLFTFSDVIFEVNCGYTAAHVSRYHRFGFIYNELLEKGKKGEPSGMYWQYLKPGDSILRERIRTYVQDHTIVMNPSWTPDLGSGITKKCEVYFMCNKPEGVQIIRYDHIHATFFDGKEYRNQTLKNDGARCFQMLVDIMKGNWFCNSNATEDRMRIPRKIQHEDL